MISDALFGNPLAKCHIMSLCMPFIGWLPLLEAEFKWPY